MELESEWEPVPLLSEAAEVAAAEEEVSWVNEPPSPTSLSALLLIAANLVPVAGTAFLGWELSDVMVLLLDSPVFLLTAVIALKVFFDLRAHIRQHGGKKAENGTH